jgi:predicted alpha/beta hydrolase
MRATDVSFAAADGRHLSGSLYEAPTPRAAVVLAGATAVPARAYSALAEGLAVSGLTVLTFDYRGVGASASGRLRKEAATMAEWGRLDLEGALAWLTARHPELPLLLLGHSVGGQLLGFAPTALALRGALLVGAQSGYWRHWKGAGRLRMWLSWHALLPAVTATLGYAPMRALAMGENLPAGVARQWARWGRHPEHLLSECSPAERERYARLGFPIRSYHFTDDAFAPLAAVEELVRFYRGASQEVITRSPEDVNATAIGHVGWLKPRFRDTLWREMADWLRARADAVSRRPSERDEKRALAQAAPSRQDGAERCAVSRAVEDLTPRAR